MERAPPLVSFVLRGGVRHLRARGQRRADPSRAAELRRRGVPGTWGQPVLPQDLELEGLLQSAKDVLIELLDVSQCINASAAATMLLSVT